MVKKQSDYYSFTALPVQESTSSSVPSAPSASTDENILPPTYEEASSNLNNLPPNKNTFEGYFLDSTAPTFNPHLEMPQPNNTRYTSDYSEAEPDVVPSVPLLNEEEYAGRPSPPGYALYQAKYKTVKEGIVSRDPHINEDPEALLQFLYQHNKPPRMKINFYGYHDETVWTTRSTRNQDGELVEEQVSSTHQITDFLFDVDCSAEISPFCQGVYILPDPKTGEQLTLRQLCDSYVHSKNHLKELKLTKEVSWDYNGLTRALTTAIRDSGFYEHVVITFKTEDHEIVVKSSSSLSRYMDNIGIQILLFISCMWVIVLPLVYFLKEKFGHSNLKSSWKMNITERDWYTYHIGEIIDSCRGRNVLSSNTAFVNRPLGFTSVSSPNVIVVPPTVNPLF